MITHFFTMFIGIKIVFPGCTSTVSGLHFIAKKCITSARQITNELITDKHTHTYTSLHYLNYCFTLVMANAAPFLFIYCITQYLRMSYRNGICFIVIEFFRVYLIQQIILILFSTKHLKLTETKPIKLLETKKEPI